MDAEFCRFVKGRVAGQENGKLLKNAAAGKRCADQPASNTTRPEQQGPRTGMSLDGLEKGRVAELQAMKGLRMVADGSGILRR